MSVFSFNYKNVYNYVDSDDKEYELICLEYNKIVNSYNIKSELYSESVWEYLTKKFDIKDEKNIITHIEVEINEKNKRHKKYKYVIKCFLNDYSDKYSTESYIYLVFNDELRGWEDSDYHEYVTEEDKSNKIYNLVVYYNPDQISTKDLEDTIVKDLIDCSYLPSTKNQFFTISTNQFGFVLKASYIKDMEIDLNLNYGEKFLPIHQEILNRLETKSHGLFLFHGDPGTGKTTYIRKIISLLSEKKTIIYIPSYMMSNIADPEFISFIAGFKNTILILEDAENVLATTINDRTQAVSNILNMTDGLLNDYMDVQIIATFNTNAKLIDNALRRAGRLQVSYKFGKLSKKDANKLAQKLGLDKNFDESVTLAEIYEGSNQIIEDDLVEKKIGFKI
ncbi:MAG: AAA family ATPase [Ignavibacteria bacterium]|nr:AAA family ATPase [Ignavibacteria bacterium]